MADKNFKVKSGLEVGSRDIITPDGTITLPSGTHGIAPLDSPVFTGTVDFTSASLDGVDALPDQTGNSGKYLTTDGSVATWSVVDSFPDQTGNSGKYLTTDGSIVSWQDAPSGANSVTVGTTSTLTPGTPATVTNSGTSTDLILDFGIPQGIQGDQGIQGETGPANTLAIGTVTSGPVDATITGTSPNQTLNLVIPPGDAATISVGTVTTVSPTTSASVTNSGTSAAAVFDFEIPKGDTGDTGATGPAGPEGDPGPMTFLLMCI